MTGTKSAATVHHETSAELTPVDDGLLRRFASGHAGMTSSHWERSNPNRTRGALVLGGDCGSLGVARSLGRRHIPVCFVAGDNPIARFSRYTHCSFSWPGPNRADAIACLLELAGRHHLEGWVLLPAADPEVQLVAQNHAALSSAYRLVTPPWETAQWALDKRLTYRRAAALGIDCPTSYYPGNRRRLAELDCRFPLVLKPAVRIGSKPPAAAKAWKVDNRADLVPVYDRAVALLGHRAVVLQDFIPGDGSTQFSYAAVWHRGAPVASMVARRTRQYPIQFGTGTFVETVQNDAVEAAAGRFLGSIGYSGIVEIEFKYDARDQRYKLLDVNARVWTWNSLGRRAGVDFPHVLWRLAMGEAVSPVRARPGAAWMYFPRDLSAALRQIWAGTLSPAAYLRCLRGPMELAAFAKDDPFPALVDLPIALWRGLRGRAKP